MPPVKPQKNSQRPSERSVMNSNISGCIPSTLNKHNRNTRYRKRRDYSEILGNSESGEPPYGAGKCTRIIRECSILALKTGKILPKRVLLQRQLQGNPDIPCRRELETGSHPAVYHLRCQKF